MVNNDNLNTEVISADLDASLKGPTKSYFVYYSCMVIVLFNTGLRRSPFSFRKLVFHLSVLSAVFCFVLTL